MSESEMRALEVSFLAAVEAHKTHRASLRLDPDGFHRCPECDPVPPAAVARPTVCPCGHPVGDEYLCIEGRIYGPCDSEHCGGVCEDHGDCKGECACGENE